LRGEFSFVFGNAPGALPHVVDVFDTPTRSHSLMNDTAGQLDLVAAAIGGFVFDWDLATGVLTRSSGIADLLGYSLDEVSTDAAWWHERVHPDDLTRVESATRAAVTDPSIHRLKADYRVRHADGSYRWIANHTWLVRDAAGRVVRMVGLTSDTAASSLAGELGIQPGTPLTDEKVLEHIRFARAEAQTARDRMTFLQRLSADLTQTLSRASVTAVVVRNLIDAFGAATGGVVELTDDGREFILLGTIGLDDDARGEWRRWPVDLPTAARDAVRTREPVLLRNADEYVARFSRSPVLDGSGTNGAWIALPLLVEDRVVGVLSMNLRAPREFPPDERQFMQAFADLCAQGLERARLYERERVGRDRAERLQAMTAVLANTRTMEEIGAAFSREVREISEADTCIVHRLTTDGKFIEALGSSGYSTEYAGAWQRVPASARTPGTDAIRSKMPQWWPNPESVAAVYPHLSDLMRASSREALAVVPLMNGDTPLGVVSLGYRHRRAFDATIREYLLALGNRCAQAMERATFYESESEARRDAEAANKAKGEFLAMMSHELRTPLNAIDGYAELLEMEIRGPLTEGQRKDVGRIRKSQRVLLGLITDILNYVRIEAGQLHYALEPVRIADLADSVIPLVAPQADFKSLDLSVRPSSTPAVVFADSDKLQQVLLNLLSNAVKFTDDGGVVTLDWSVCDRNIEIRVADSGIGVPDERLEAIFEPFVQVDTSLTRVHHGTGLGLAISRELVRGMGGDLRVESSVGIGSTFTVTLPGQSAI
jgi:signal transduction histidine kinase